MAEDNPAQKYNKRLKALENERQKTDLLYQDIASYILPRKGSFTKKGEPQVELYSENVIDGTATRALRVLAAGMQGGLTSPARPWFRLGLVDEDLMEFGPVKDWLHITQRQMYAVFSRSNFYSSIHTVYQELGGFGTDALVVDEHPEFIIHTRPQTAGEYCISVNEFGIVDTFYRRFWRTARTLVRQFGEENVSDAVKQSMKSDPYKWIECGHAVQPREDRDVTLQDNQNMPWESVYWEISTPEKLLNESGYRDFPVMAPRWDVTGSEIYGRSPGMDVLPDVMTLQEMAQGELEGLQQTLNPAMLVPNSFQDRLRRSPGSENVSGGKKTEGIRRLFDFNFDISGTTAKIQDMRLQIREGLYNDLFLMLLERPQMTATEVLERREEKLLLLGPVIERQEFELLNPLIDRTFSIMEDMGMITPPPQELSGMNLKVEYISTLAQAQKLVATQSIGSLTDFVGAVAAINPEVVDKVDWDEAVEQFGEATGVAPKVIRTDEDVAEIRMARAQQEQAAQALESAQMGADTAQTMSDTSTEGGTVLAELAASMEGL